MERASSPEHAYSHSSNDIGANDNRAPARNAWRRLRPSQWAALIALLTLLTATTVQALTPRELKLPPDFDEQMDKLALAIMLMPCDHREPGYPDVRVTDRRYVSAGAAD